MSKYDYNYEATSNPKQSAKLEVWDMLTIATLLLTLCLGVYFVAIFIFPQSAINPLKASMVDPNAPPTATITPLQLDATWTATPFSIVTETPTLLPTHTLIPSPTLFSLITPSDTPTPTPIKAQFPTDLSAVMISTRSACWSRGELMESFAIPARPGRWPGSRRNRCMADELGFVSSHI